MTAALLDVAQAAGVTTDELASALLDVALDALLDHAGNLAFVESAEAMRPGGPLPSRETTPEHLRRAVAELLPSLASKSL